MKMSCIPTSAASLWYSVALKAPRGDQTHTFWSSNRGGSSPVTIINTWLSDVFTHTQQTWDGYVYYNDQLPEDASEASFLNGITNDGHCKGIVVWNTQAIGWLIHSIPRFPMPVKFDPTKTTVSENQLVYGQSAIYIEIPRMRDTLDDVLIQLSTMQAQIYDYSGLSPSIIDSMQRIYSSKAIQTNQFIIPSHQMNSWMYKLRRTNHRRYITHIAKPNKCIYDIYETIVAKTDKGVAIPLVCETWQNGSGKKTPNAPSVTNLHSIGNKWDSTTDHSKWAISMPYIHHGWFKTHMKNDWRVFIGDLNRMNSQHSRGGGGVIIDGDKELWEWFYNHVFGTSS